jgi:putative transposase
MLYPSARKAGEIEMLRRIDIIAEEAEAAKRMLKMMTEMLETRCKFCGSDNVVKNGKSRKGVQNWLCKACGKAFVDNRALPRMRSPVDTVASALWQYYAGSSLNEIRGYIEQQSGFKPSDSTIYHWVTRFSKVAVNEANKCKPEVGDRWVADETVLFIGSKKYWLWDIIDSHSRFLIATYLSRTRGTRDAQQLMKLAYERTRKVPKVILTDKLASYLDGIELQFGSETKHIQSKPFTETDSTNLIERFQGTLKDRTKVMRGMKTPESARLILDGWLVYYNFFRPHESLKDKTPAEVAKIRFPFRNWADVVISQAPTAQVVKDDGKTIIISADYEGSRKLKKVRRRRLRKKQAMRMVNPTASIVRGI